MLNNRLSLLLLLAPSLFAQANLGSTTLINSFETAQDLKMLSTTSATYTKVTQDVTNGQYALQVNFQVASFPSINFLSQLAGLQPWNWSNFGGLAFDVCNPTGQTVAVSLVMTDATPLNGADKSHVADWSAPVGADSCGTMLTLFQNSPSPLSMGMQGGPPVPGYIVMQQGDGTVDFSHVYQFDFYLNNPTSPATLIFDNVRVFTANVGSLLYTGIVDSYGQFTGEAWPGKVSSDNDLQVEAQAESALPFPASGSLDPYGGNLSLPSVAATGFFRTTQDAAGKWWLVTPLGHLFFATGMDEIPYLTTAKIATGQRTTDTQGRLQMFTSLPASTDPLAAFYTPAWSTWPPPASLGIQLSLGSGYDFYSANLYRKYGASYQANWWQSTIDRFTRWGINEIGSFSDPAIYSVTGTLGQKIPHVVTLSYSSCTGCGNFSFVTTSQDWWGPMVDPFDPAWAAAVDSTFAQQIPAYLSDAYLIGYYCDNELSWAGGVNDPNDSNHYSLVYGVLNSASTQPAKQAFIQVLTTEYSDVAKLNQSWQTNFASWSALFATPYNAPVPLPTASMRADFSAFLLSYAQQYFQTISSKIKKYDPHHLYLGVKFSAFAIEQWQACAQICDVVSFDDYNPRLVPATWAFMNQFQKPAILAEFSFISTDRGSFSGKAGTALVSSQNARALSYGLKMQDVATNPNLLGATWYDYVDEPITGQQPDGENFNWGFVPVTDTPYPELTGAATVVNSVVGAWRTLPATQAAAPAVSSINPITAPTGSADVLLTVTGSGFGMNSAVQWNGSAEQTLYISGTQLWALVPAASLTSAAQASITVSTPGGGLSSAVTFAVGNLPVISGIGNAAGGQPGVASGGLISIYGANFTPLTYDDWTKSIINGVLPTKLDGVSVTIGGKAAFVNVVTPGQLNVQAPDLSAGPVQVVVTNPNGTSAAFATTAAVYSPAFFPWPGNQPVATHADYSLAAKNGAFAGLSTVPAKPGEVIILWGTGFGPTNPAVPAGQEPTVQAPPTQATVSVTLGSSTAPVLGAVLSSYAATYQIAIQIPAGIADGDYPIVATVNGVGSPPNMLLTVHE